MLLLWLAVSTVFYCFNAKLLLPFSLFPSISIFVYLSPCCSLFQHQFVVLPSVSLFQYSYCFFVSVFLDSWILGVFTCWTGILVLTLAWLSLSFLNKSLTLTCSACRLHRGPTSGTQSWTQEAFLYDLTYTFILYVFTDNGSSDCHETLFTGQQRKRAKVQTLPSEPTSLQEQSACPPSQAFPLVVKP